MYALRNGDTLSKYILEELEKEGQPVRKYYQRRLPSNPSKDYYFIHRQTGNTEPVLIEYGFLDTPEDAQRLKENYKDYAEAVVRAVLRYIGKPYTPVPGSNTYVVKTGDSLWNIAKQFGITADELKTANNLTSNSLSVGQTLKIPRKEETPSTNNEYYTVKSGDSLWTIANRYGMTVDELKQLNKLTNNNLSIGQKLLIRSKNGSTSNPTTGGTHTVKSGDSLWTIANKYGTTVDEVKRLNNLSTNNLSIGQTLKIPTNLAAPASSYTVKSGDSLWTIANQFGTTVDSIKIMNNLTTNNLTIGQKLKVR